MCETHMSVLKKSLSLLSFLSSPLAANGAWGGAPRLEGKVIAFVRSSFQKTVT
jgi:hypothetical protein